MPPLAVLNGPTMSNPYTANGQVSGIILSAEAGWWLLDLKRWQPLHLFTRSSAAARAVGK